MKLNQVFRPPSLWRFLKDNIPSSMEAIELTIGYGTACNIYRKGDAPGLLKRAFDVEGYPLASVSGTELRLNYPEYFSDFEDLLRRFETSSGIEPTLTYWQSPKDERPGMNSPRREGK